MGVESSCGSSEDSCEYTIYSTYVRTYVCPNAPLSWRCMCSETRVAYKSKLCSIALAVLYVPYMPCLLCVVLAV